jgi:hypothetical protein
VVTSALYGVGGVFLFMWLFWYVYILVMGLYRAHLVKNLTRFTYALALPALLIGYAMDVLANAFVATIVFREPPEEWLVTDRLKRYIEGPCGWRKTRAQAICAALLDSFDPHGSHCTPGGSVGT